VCPGKIHIVTARLASSIRLGVFRYNLEDYRCLWLFEQEIDRAVVMSYVRQLVTNCWDYNKDISEFEYVRDKIAKRIEN